MSEPKKYLVYNYDNPNNLSKVVIYIGTLEDDPSTFIAIVLLSAKSRSETIPVAQGKNEDEVLQQAKNWLKESLGDFEIMPA